MRRVDFKDGIDMAEEFYAALEFSGDNRATAVSNSTEPHSVVVTSDLDALVARVAELEEAQTRHLELIRDMTQAPLPEDCVEARNRVGVLTAKCATLVREKSELEAENKRMRLALAGLVDALPKCAEPACGIPATRGEWCDEHGIADDGIAAHDLDFAAPLRIARKALGRTGA